MRLISLHALKDKMESGESFRLVNALDPPNYQAIHLPGSLNIYTKEGILHLLNPEEEIVVYCTNVGCNRSIILYQLLEALGYRNIFRFAGGIEEWVRAGYPVERD